MSSTTSKVIGGFKRLMRARQSLFTGDERAMRESRIAIRTEYVKNRNVTDPVQIEGLIVMADEATDMLLHGIVRGELNQDKNAYEVKIKKEHADSMDSETITHVDPITAETSLNEDTGNPDVVVTSTSGKGSCGKH